MDDEAADEVVTITRTKLGWRFKRHYRVDPGEEWSNPIQVHVVPGLDTPRLYSELTAWVEDVLRREESRKGDTPPPGAL